MQVAPVRLVSGATRRFNKRGSIDLASGTLVHGNRNTPHPHVERVRLVHERGPDGLRGGRNHCLCHHVSEEHGNDRKHHEVQYQRRVEANTTGKRETCGH